MDACVVCHTPVPKSVVRSASDTGADTDDTRLAQPSEQRVIRTFVPAEADMRGAPVLQPGQTFANRYTIIRLLGAGGMAAVYQAWDETLASAVALKLIRIDPSMEPADIRQLEERFKRELKLARQVTHPNVVRIHDLGEVEGTLYLTMACVQGSDLAASLRQGRMPIGRALSLARQIASGLAAAHRAGVVHRDLKPANILVDEGDQALITDFGIARSTAADQARVPDLPIGHAQPEMSLHTMPGAIMGTLEYMAPEQARGEAADGRTDIYAFGLILYELVAGGRPRVSREGGMAELIARLEKGPPPLRSVVPDVPDDVERIVETCLQRDPAARYATANDLLADLERLDAEGRPLPLPKRVPRWKILSAAAVLGALLVTGTWWAASNRVQLSPTQRPAVPVLIVDFENRAQEPVFDGALEQALSIAMEGAPFITAYPRRDAASLVRSLKLGDRLDQNSGRLLANREGIRIILAGSIDRAGSGYRVEVRAIDLENPQEPMVVADARAPDKNAVLGAVGRVAERVRNALGDTTPSEQQQKETFTAASLDAVREYTIAQDLSANQRDGEAVGHYKTALTHDPEFGRAYAGLAMSLYYLGQREEAEQHWDAALKRIDRMSEREKLRTRGVYFAGPARNYKQAIDEYLKLVASYPADSAAHNNLAVAYFNTLNFNKALEHGQIAIKIYPRSFKYRANHALYAMYAGDFKAAAETAQKLVEEDPSFETAYLPLAMEALASGDPARARVFYQQASKAGEAGASLAAIGLADVGMFQGQSDEVIASLPPWIERDLEQKNAFGAVAKLLALGQAQAARGRAAAAQAALARARDLAEDDSVLVTTARVAVDSGRTDQARAIAAELGKRFPAQSRALGKVIEAELAMRARQYPAALDALNAAKELADFWLVRYTRGHAYFQGQDYQGALAEFEECQRRRGEATAVFLDDSPTFRYYAVVPYWLGRAREMRGLDPRPQYEEFLAIRGAAAADPLVVDARQRVAALGKLP